MYLGVAVAVRQLAVLVGERPDRQELLSNPDVDFAVDEDERRLVCGGAGAVPRPVEGVRHRRAGHIV